jgi:hypothetical protein
MGNSMTEISSDDKKGLADNLVDRMMRYRSIRCNSPQCPDLSLRFGILPRSYSLAVLNPKYI